MNYNLVKESKKLQQIGELKLNRVQTRYLETLELGKQESLVNPQQANRSLGVVDQADEAQMYDDSDGQLLGAYPVIAS